MNFNRKLCIVGTGGFAREVLVLSKLLYEEINIDYRDQIIFLVKDEEYNDKKILGVQQLKESDFDPDKFEVAIAIGNPSLRKKIVEKLPKNTKYATLIHPNADIGLANIIGEGSIITSGVIITCNVKIGMHVQLNLNTTIGHDNIIKNYVTTAPAVNISGSCCIGQNVYLGTGALVREDINIVKNSIIGMGSVVVKNIDESGTYVGNPAKKIK